MDITQNSFSDGKVIVLAGSIDAMTADEVRQYFHQQFSQGEKNFIADLSQVDFMSSAGLRVIMEVLKRSRGSGGDLRLAGAQPGVARVLDMSGFNTILRTYPALGEAIDSFAG